MVSKSTFENGPQKVNFLFSENRIEHKGQVLQEEKGGISCLFFSNVEDLCEQTDGPN